MSYAEGGLFKPGEWKLAARSVCVVGGLPDARADQHAAQDAAQEALDARLEELRRDLEERLPGVRVVIGG